MAIRGRRTNHRTTECAEQTPHCPGHCTVHGLRNLRTVWPESCKSFEISNLRAVCGWLHGEGTSNPSVIHPMASSVQSLEDGAHHAGRSWIGKLARVRDGGREIVSPLPCLLAFGAQCGRAGKISPLKSPEIKNADGHKGRKDATPYLGRSEAVGLGVWDAFSRHGVLAYPSARTRTGMDGKRPQGHPKHACGDGGGGLFARGLGRNHPRSGTVEVGPIENFQVNEQNENQKGCQEEEGGRGQGRAHEVQGEDGQERQEGFHGSSKVLWLEQWKWSLLGAAAWATVLVQDSTPSSLHYLRFTWPSLEELSKRQEERMKQHGKEGSSRRSRSPRRNREDPNRGKPYPKGEEHQHHQIDPEDLLTRLRTSSTLEEYTARRTFIFVHHFAGPDDPLSKAMVREARARNVRLRVISVEKTAGSGDLLQDQPYTDHLTWGAASHIDGYHEGFPCSTFSRLRHRQNRVATSCQVQGRAPRHAGEYKISTR